MCGYRCGCRWSRHLIFFLYIQARWRIHVPCQLETASSEHRVSPTNTHTHTQTTTVLDLHIRNVGCSQGKTLASVFQRKGVASDFKFFKKPYFCSKDKKCLGSASQHLLRHSRTGCPKHVANPGTSSGQKRQPLMSEQRAVNQANTWTFKPELLPEVLGNWSFTVGIFCTEYYHGWVLLWKLFLTLTSIL